MNTRPVRFFHRAAVVEVDVALAVSTGSATRTVLQWLREEDRKSVV